MAEDNKVCRSCRKSVDIQAKKCPYCQEDLRSWFRRHPILTFIGIIFFFPLFTGLLNTPNNKTSTSVNNQKSELPTQSPQKVTLIDKIKNTQSEPGQVFAINGVNVFVGETTDSIINKLGKANSIISDNSEYETYGIVTEYKYDKYSLLMAREPINQNYYIVWDIYLNE